MTDAERKSDELVRQEERALTVVALENAIRNPGGTFQMPLEAVMVEHRLRLAEARREEREACIEAISRQWPKARGLFQIARDAILARDKEPLERAAAIEAAGEKACSHKFVDSKHCLKCGWMPNDKEPSDAER